MKKNYDICSLNAVIWALENNYPCFIELKPEFIEIAEGYSEPLSSPDWTRVTIWGLTERPDVLEHVFLKSICLFFVAKIFKISHIILNYMITPPVTEIFVYFFFILVGYRR